MSMSNDELQQLLLATFADQAKEQLQTINQRLLALEEAEGDDKGPLLEEIFREAHSLKGASRAVDLGRVETVAHKLERYPAVGPDLYTFVQLRVKKQPNFDDITRIKTVIPCSASRRNGRK